MTQETKGDEAHSEISSLIDAMAGPDYITHDFSDVNIKSIIILSSVFRVDNSYLGSYLGRCLNANRSLVEDKNILDLGCGCGLLGLICALSGARSVHFSDINPVAVKNSRLNSILLDVENVSFSTGDLFDGVFKGSVFDLIVFNPPTVAGLPANNAEAAFFREDRVITDFYKLFPDFLSKKGQVIIPGSSRFDLHTAPITLAREYNLQSRIIAEEFEDDGSNKYILLLDNPN